MKAHCKNVLQGSEFPRTRAIASVLCLLLCVGIWTPALAQRSGREITGTVVDENNQPMPGVTVMVENTVTGTMTGSDGSFLLKGVPADATLLVSCIGYVTQR